MHLNGSLPIILLFSLPLATVKQSSDVDIRPTISKVQQARNDAQERIILNREI